MSTILHRHMQQSPEWAEFRKALGVKIVSQYGDDWRFQAAIERGDGRFGKYFKRLYCPYGPSATSKNSYSDALLALSNYAKNHSIDFIRIDVPEDPGFAEAAKNNGYTKTQRLAQPDRTLHLDLTKTTGDILKDMSKTNQYLWRKASDNGLTFSHSYLPKDLKPLNLMLKETSERAGAIFHESDYYKTLLTVLGPSKHAGVAYAYHNDQPVVGAIFYDDNDQKTRYYMYAYSFNSARKLSANSPLLTYLIINAKDTGLKTFDMFGVSPLDQPNHRWAGFSKFKRTFGGKEITYGGTWEKPIKQVRYSALTFARKISS